MSVLTAVLVKTKKGGSGYLKEVEKDKWFTVIHPGGSNPFLAFLRNYCSPGSINLV